MKFVATSALLLGLSSIASADLSVNNAPQGPIPGVYSFINRVLSPHDDRLAMTFNGEGKAAILAPYTNATTQLWSIQNYNSQTQMVSPVDAPNLQASKSNQGVKIISRPGNQNYVWKITSTTSGWTIQDGSGANYWGATTATNGSIVTVAQGTGSVMERWILYQW